MRNNAVFLKHTPKILVAAVLSVGSGIASTALADESAVVSATASCDDKRTCSFSVTVKHADTGWDHYANHWRVLAPDGTELGKRVLYHPHENEQPFTRSLSGVQIPEGIEEVTIESHDSVHEYGGEVFTVKIP